MKKWILACVLGFAASQAAWAGTEQASLLVYVSPNKLDHPVQIGLQPYSRHWVWQGQIAAKAATHLLGQHFAKTEMCDSGQTSDVIAWVKPRLLYNPGVERYYAMLKVEFHLGDGRSLANYKAVGEQTGNVNSAYVDETVGKAFNIAMESIATQFAGDAAVQQAIADAMSKDFTRKPCMAMGVYWNGDRAE